MTREAAGVGPEPAERESGLGAAEAARLRALLAAVEAGLVEALPGLSVLDRDLELDGGRCVDLLGLDAARRLVLVLLVGGEDEGRDVLPAVADAVVFARQNGALLGRHWDLVETPRADLEPVIVVVSDRFSAAARERLELLAGVDLRLFEVRELTSATGARVFLVPSDRPGAPAGGEPLGLAAFLAALPEPVAALAGELVARLERVDDRLQRAVTRRGVQWTWEGRATAGLSWNAGRLEGEIAEGGCAQPIGVRADVEAFVEAALAAHLERLRDAPREVQRNGRPEPRPALGPDLLTPEEIEAFRE